MGFWQHVQEWEICIFIFCAALLLWFASERMDIENMLKKDSPIPVHMGGAIKPGGKLQHVTLENIPSFVYETLDKDKKFKRYLTGNHKYIFLFDYSGCSYCAGYRRTFKDAFKKQGFSQYYRKRIAKVGNVWSVFCPETQTCASSWFYEHCWMNLCLINPQRKKLIIDRSHNAEQLPKLLEKYKEW